MPGKEPQKLLLRRRDVLEWAGISLAEFKKLVRAGIIVGRHLREDSRAYYPREHVRAVLLGEI